MKIEILVRNKLDIPGFNLTGNKNKKEIQALKYDNIIFSYTGCPRKNETHFQSLISLKLFNQ